MPIRRYARIFFYGVSLLSALLFFTPAHADSRNIRVGTYNYNPLIFIQKDGASKGLFVDVLNHIAAKEQWQVTYVPGSWQEGLERLKSNQIDLLVCVGYSAEREKIMDYTNDYLVLDWGVVYRHRGSKINTILDLEGKTVSALKGSIFVTGFRTLAEQFHVNVKILEKLESREIFSSIQSHETEVGITGNIFGVGLMNTYGVEQSPVVFSPIRMCFAANRGINGDLVEALNRNLKELKSDRNSFYYKKLNEWTGGGERQLPQEVFVGLLVLLCGIMLLSLFVFVLKRQVRARTKEILAAQDGLRQQALQLEEELAERQAAQEALQEQAAILEEEIEERVRAETELLATSQRLNLAVSSARMGVWDWDLKNDGMVWNDRMFQLYGLDPESSPASIDNWLHGLHPDDKERALAECQAALRGEAEFNTEFRVLHPDGTVKHLKADGIVVKGADGTALRMIGLNFDITDQKQWEGTLEHRLSLVTNPAVSSTSMIFTDLFDLDEIQKIQDSFALATGVASIITDTQGIPITRPSNFSNLCHIIRSMEKGLANCIHSDAVIGMFNEQGPNVGNCLSGGLLDGGASIHVGGHHIANWLIGQVLDESCDTDKMMAYADEIGADQQEYRQALSRVTRMPREQFENVCNALFCIAGQLSALAIQNLNQAQYIMERKKTEAALQEREEQYRTLFTELNSGFALHEIICDEAGVPYNYRFLAINNAFEKMIGKPADQIVGKTILEIKPDMPKSRIEHFASVAVTGISEEFEDHSPLIGKDLEIRIFSPRPNQFAVILKDITARKLLEEQLRQSQKMEAIGQLAGGVAHDFNNILTVIMGHASLLEIDPTIGPLQRQAAEQIVASSQKAAHLTKGLLAFSRKQLLDVKENDLNDIVRHVENFLTRIIGEDIQLKTICGARNLIVNCDRSQIEQVLINLATNARDAMKNHGLLTVETSLQEVDALTPLKQGSGFAKHGWYACISVSDTGSGMDAETCSKIFEPFFTTKEIGKGTGLGMAIVYGIIQQHNGFINVYSEVGIGTTFKIHLPIASMEQIARMEEHAPAELQGGTETILLAEDDTSVRTLVTAVLTQFGYTVLEAEDGQEAIDLFSTERDGIDLILMDMIMPKKNGREAYEEINGIRPGVKVLYSSGYTADFIQNRGVSEEGIELLMKPVQPKELLRKVREMLDAP